MMRSLNNTVSLCMNFFGNVILRKLGNKDQYTFKWFVYKVLHIAESSILYPPNGSELAVLDSAIVVQYLGYDVNKDHAVSVSGE